MEHRGTMFLETERLVLRKFREDDAQAMFDNWASNPNVAKYIEWSLHKNVETTKFIVGEWIERYQNPNFYQWAIELKESGKPIGSISVVQINEKTDACEVGYCIGEKWWNQGITTEALKRVITFLFDEVQVTRISAMYNTKNSASGRVMQKSGFEYERNLRRMEKNNLNVPCDFAVYSISRQYR